MLSEVCLPSREFLILFTKPSKFHSHRTPPSPYPQFPTAQDPHFSSPHPQTHKRSSVSLHYRVLEINVTTSITVADHWITHDLISTEKGGRILFKTIKLSFRIWEEYRLSQERTRTRSHPVFYSTSHFWFCLSMCFTALCLQPGISWSSAHRTNCIIHASWETHSSCHSTKKQNIWLSPVQIQILGEGNLIR